MWYRFLFFIRFFDFLENLIVIFFSILVLVNVLLMLFDGIVISIN